MSEKKPSKVIAEAREALRVPVRDANDVTAPAIRKGEDSMSSRPFSLLRVLGANAGKVDQDKVKIEKDILSRFSKALEDTGGMTHLREGGYASIMVPGARDFLGVDMAEHPATKEFLLSQAYGCNRVDPDEVAWIAEKIGRVQKGYGAQYQKTAMSYLTDTIGGSLVAPPEMGELIPLMRNKSALDAAGARQVPLPPNGKWVAPRQTGPTTGYWVGENTTITESNPTTGEVSMMAKKLATITRVPNELFKYATPAADAMLRDDVTKTLALGVDYAGLYGLGGGNQPKGAIYYTGTNEVLFYESSTPTPSGVGANGNTLNPQDGYVMNAAIADRNFDADGKTWKWIMRPKMWGAAAARRSDAVTAGDSAGVFVQSLTRILGDSVGAEWCGHGVVRSSQIPNNLTKGAGTGLTDVWGGVWNEMLMGIYGAIEFVSNPMGDGFAQDQTLIRSIIFADSTLRYPGAFTVYRNMIMQ